jgi:histone acetyltransferase HTATIP
MTEGCRVPVFMDIQNTFGIKQELKNELSTFVFLLVPAEIVSIRENDGVHEFYIHYINFNRRLDEWVTVDKMNLQELAPPSSSTSSSSNNISQEIAITQQSRTVPTSTTTASTSNEIPSGNTTTFFLSDDADSLNSDLSQAAALPSFTNAIPATPTTVVPTKIRGNGNTHGGGVHSVTKVKNINLIHLGRYFIKPWYFSPYPEVKSY